MNCNVCDGFTFRAINKRNCESCVAETMLKKGMLTLETAKKFCDCFRFGHDKDKLEEHETNMRTFKNLEKRKSIEREKNHADC